MSTKYCENNLSPYKLELTKSFGDTNGASIPDEDYLEYALRNSPSTVRFLLKGNGSMELLKDKHDVHLVWENLIFSNIQEDLKNKILLNPSNYYTGYLPITKKTLEKLLERRTEKKEERNSFINVIKNFF